MIVYSNSDSLGIVSDTENRYPEFLGLALNAEVVNKGRRGASNQRIIRTTLRDLIKIRDKNSTEEILAVIGLGSLYRIEWWNESYQAKPHETDGNFQPIQIHDVDNKNEPFYKFSQEWLKLFNEEAEQTNLLMNLVLLTTWFKTNNINYIIFAGNNNFTYKKCDYNDVFIQPFSKIVFNDPNILNINDFSFVRYCLDKNYIPIDYDLYQNNGHHGEEGHKDFAEFLLNFYNTHIKKS